MPQTNTTLKPQTVQGIVSRYQKAQRVGDAEMGEALGLSRQTIWRWRTGSSEPSEEQLQRLAQVFRVSDWQFQMAMKIAECQLAAMRARIKAAIA